MLTVLCRVKSKSENPRWLCKCDCGKEHEVQGSALKCIKTRSCGCLLATTGKYVGNERHMLQQILNGMKQRCRNPKNKKYPRYGLRGISVCKEWDHYKDFAKWAYANGYKPGLSVDRIDNDGDYVPENCRIITKSENARKRDKKLDEASTQVPHPHLRPPCPPPRPCQGTQGSKPAGGPGQPRQYPALPEQLQQAQQGL